MRDKRPVNLDIGTIELPIAAYASILHRVSGIIVFVGVGVLLWLLDKSLSSNESFGSLESFFSSFFWRFVLWGCLSALAYHLIAGCKHLLMDVGVAETKESAPIAAKLVLALATIIIVLLGVYLW